MERRHLGTEIDFYVPLAGDLSDVLLGAHRAIRLNGLKGGVHRFMHLDKKALKQYVKVFVNGDRLSDGPVGCIVAVAPIGVVGMLGWTRFNSGYSDIFLPQVSHIILHPCYRSSGVGAVLLELFKEQVKEVGGDRYIMGHSVPNKSFEGYLKRKGTPIGTSYIIEL